LLASRKTSGLLSGNDDPHCAATRAVAAAFLTHRPSRSATFQATGNNIQFLQGTVREFGRVLEQFGMMVGAQPLDQPAFKAFAVVGAELCAAVIPPIVNAGVANELPASKRLPGSVRRKNFLHQEQALTPSNPKASFSRSSSSLWRASISSKRGSDFSAIGSLSFPGGIAAHETMEPGSRKKKAPTVEPWADSS
jgi:hypothetical protein